MTQIWTPTDLDSSAWIPFRYFLEQGSSAWAVLSLHGKAAHRQHCFGYYSNKQTKMQEGREIYVPVKTYLRALTSVHN